MDQRLSAATVIGLGAIHMVSRPIRPQALDHRTILCRCFTSASPCSASRREPRAWQSFLKAARSVRAIHASSAAVGAATCGSSVADAKIGLERRDCGAVKWASAGVDAAIDPGSRADEATRAEEACARATTASMVPVRPWCV
eukprot:2538885-Pleurochrysis_carterae.AAC.3